MKLRWTRISESDRKNRVHVVAAERLPQGICRTRSAPLVVPPGLLLHPGGGELSLLKPLQMGEIGYALRKRGQLL
jgi:hypothetical protein